MLAAGWLVVCGSDKENRTGAWGGGDPRPEEEGRAPQGQVWGLQKPPRPAKQWGMFSSRGGGRVLPRGWRGSTGRTEERPPGRGSSRRAEGPRTLRFLETLLMSFFPLESELYL